MLTENQRQAIRAAQDAARKLERMAHDAASAWQQSRAAYDCLIAKGGGDALAFVTANGLPLPQAVAAPVVHVVDAPAADVPAAAPVAVEPAIAIVSPEVPSPIGAAPPKGKFGKHAHSHK